MRSASDAPPCENRSIADQAIGPAPVPSPCENQRFKRISACDGIGRHARFRFSCRETCGFESLQAHHVVADCISFATTFSFSKQTSSLTHSVAPPLQIATAALGCNLVLGATLEATVFAQFRCCRKKYAVACFFQ